MDYLSLAGDVARILCCYKCGGRGMLTGVNFPISPSKLESMDDVAGWLTVAMRTFGTLDEETRATRVEIRKPTRTGLLSTSRIVVVQFSNGTSRTMYAKFAPLEAKTRITTDVFEMAKNEFEFYTSVAPSLLEAGVRIPRCAFVDMNATTKNTILLMDELRNVEFLDQLNHDLSFDDAAIVTSAMARMHARWLGVGSMTPTIHEHDDAIERIDYIDAFKYKLVRPLAKHAWGKIQCRDRPTSRRLGKGPRVCPENGNDGNVRRAKHPLSFEIPEEIHRLLVDDVFDNFNELIRVVATSRTNGLCHGDPRLENFFFYKDERSGKRDAGMLDFQLLIKGTVLTDISWFVGTSLSVAFADKHEEALLDTYLNEMERLSGKTLNRKLWLEMYDLSFVATLLKMIIGCDSVDVKIPRTVQLCDAHMTRALGAFHRRDIIGTWRRFMQGKTIEKKR